MSRSRLTAAFANCSTTLFSHWTVILSTRFVLSRTEAQALEVSPANVGSVNLGPCPGHASRCNWNYCADVIPPEHRFFEVDLGLVATVCFVNM